MGDVELDMRFASTSPNRQEVGVTTAEVKESQYYTDTALYKKMKSLLLFCTIGGLHFKKDFRVTGIKRHLYGSHVYSCLIVLFVMVNVLRWLNMFHGNEVFGYPSFKTLQCIWGLESIGHVIACLMSCESFDRLPRFFVEWEMLQVNDSKILNSMKRITDVCTVGLWLFVCTSFGFTVYLQLFTEVLDITLTPWDKYSKYVVVIQIISLVHQFYVTIAWFAPTVLMFIICKALAYRFQDVTEEVRILSKEGILNNIETFEGLRLCHQNLCNLVRTADNIFSTQIAISLSGSTITACLLMYSIAYEDSSGTDQRLAIAIKSFWLSASLMKVIIDCVSGAILNDAVRGTVLYEHPNSDIKISGDHFVNHAIMFYDLWCCNDQRSVDLDGLSFFLINPNTYQSQNDTIITLLHNILNSAE